MQDAGLGNWRLDGVSREVDQHVGAAPGGAPPDAGPLGQLVHLDNAPFRAIKASTPGPYTFILPATKEVPRKLAHPKKKTVGVRIPDHTVVRALLHELGEPLLSSTLLMPGADTAMTQGWEVKEELDHLIDAVIDALDLPDVDMATLACPIDSDEEYTSRDIVKVVTDLSDNALYFSRSPIPFGSRALARRHIGLYGYQSRVLRALAGTESSPLEVAESLEQLRALQNGFKIKVLHTDKPHLGVDRPEDVLRVESELAKLR